MGGIGVACEGPLHEVKVAPFHMGRSPVTNQTFERFLTENPHEPVPRFWDPSSPRESDAPVVGISWETARRFARWSGGRLPSEAEWEYVARLSQRELRALGIRGLFGTVVQWVEDDWHSSYLAAPAEGSAWIDTPRSVLRVVRGTAWFHDPTLVRPSLRSWDQPLAQDDYIGFRIAADDRMSGCS
jgi:formylglycine-generating enzyme required for sulfatase activity